MDDKSLVRISKLLSFVLRHGAIKRGLQISPDGFVSVKELLLLDDFRRNKVSLDVIKIIVEQNDKRRFELADLNAQLFIRAVQGHSIAHVDSDQLLKRITEDDLKSMSVIVHGTTKKAWKSIQNEGLNKMGRNHIHFAQGYPSDGVVSGMRSSSQVFIELDALATLKGGIALYQSKNGVILSPGIDGVIPPKFFKAVYDSTKHQLL